MALLHFKVGDVNPTRPEHGCIVGIISLAIYENEVTEVDWQAEDEDATVMFMQLFRLYPNMLNNANIAIMAIKILEIESAKNN